MNQTQIRDLSDLCDAIESFVYGAYIRHDMIKFGGVHGVDLFVARFGIKALRDFVYDVLKGTRPMPVAEKLTDEDFYSRTALQVVDAFSAHLHLFDVYKRKPIPVNLPVGILMKRIHQSAVQSFVKLSGLKWPTAKQYALKVQTDNDKHTRWVFLLNDREREDFNRALQSSNSQCDVQADDWERITQVWEWKGAPVQIFDEEKEYA